jgi:protein-S-isoprenylcysteine O-methyltransferase Ste14
MKTYILIFIWTIYLVYWILASRKNKKARYHKKSLLGGIFARTLLIGIIILLWVIPIFSIHIFTPSLSHTTTGILTTFLGLCFAFWARVALGNNWSANPIELKNNHQLVTTGPYSYVRHPIYSGVILALLGTFVATGQYHTLILLLLVGTGLFVRCFTEDSLMLHEFPEVFTDYKKKVKMLVPKVF